MPNYKLIPPKQKYLTLSQIYGTVGSRGVVAYSCKIADSVPEGGFVIAVLNSSDGYAGEIKAFQRQLIKRNPDSVPIYYLRVEKPDSSGRSLVLTYNAIGGGKDEKAIIPLKSKTEEAIGHIPGEHLAKAINTVLKD